MAVTKKITDITKANDYLTEIQKMMVILDRKVKDCDVTATDELMQIPNNLYDLARDGVIKPNEFLQIMLEFGEAHETFKRTCECNRIITGME